jgi:uncharacterized protein YecA (UPF0149 family)
LPATFLGGLHDLRFLGNDAVHLDLKHFDQVSRAEAEAGLDVLRFLLNSLYQYEAAMQKIKALKRSDV